MIIELNTDERVFQLTKLGFGSKTVFCNLKHIPHILTYEFEKYDEVKALHFWNGKFTIASKKLLNEMFEANQIQYKIK